MKRIALFLKLTAAAAALGCLAAACTPETVSPTGLADAGLIFSNDCASCHASDRTGDHGPDIRPASLKDYSQTSLAAFLGDHKTAKNLTAEQRAILAEWLKK